MSGPDLRTLQRWFQHVITHPESSAQGVRSSGESGAGVVTLEQVATLVRPSSRMDPLQRLGVYQHAYFARLIECLEEDYPTLRALCGEQRFAKLARQYIVQHPPDSPGLSQFGSELAAMCRAEPSPDASGLAALAELEWTIGALVHEPSALQLTAADIALHGERWGQARLTPIPALRLLELACPAYELLRARRDGRPLELPTPAVSAVLVYRPEWTVRYLALSAPEATLLRAILSGVPIGEALANAAAAGASESDVGDWFRNWLQNGYFCAITAEN